MSSFEPGGIVQKPVGNTRRAFFVLVAVAVLVAAVAGIVAEPWFLFRRISRAVAEGDLEALHSLVDPAVSLEQLGRALVLAKATPGTRVSQGYEGLSRFVVTARTRGGAGGTGPSELTFVLERHGLSWWLTGIGPDDALAAAPMPDEPGEALPPLGSYVYVDDLPEALVRVPPEYPELARRAGVSGTVLVQALVGRDGLVKDVRVSKSIPMLDDAAVTAVRRWRFQAAMAKGEPVAVWVAVPVKFTLH